MKSYSKGFAGSLALYKQPLCHDVESFALLQFKESFIFNRSASYAPSAYSKVSSWMIRSNDCCTRDGVECDENTGHVVSLDLSNSSLYGSINTSSSLFQLVHLQKLNLAYNNFIHSEIPIGVGWLSKLTDLNLSCSGFLGIFQPPNLKTLSVRFNLNLTGRVPEFNRSSRLEVLGLAVTSFSGKLPDSIGNLKSLYFLDVSKCNFSGPIPSSLANLTELTLLSLSVNNFSSESLSWIGDFPDFPRNQDQLEVLSLSMNNIPGQIPKWIMNFSKYSTLQILDLSVNFLTGFGQTPYALPWTNLQILDLRYNNIQGSLPIPPPSIVVYQFTNNMLSGVISEMICDLTSLSFLDLQYNNLVASFPNLKDLRNLSTLNLRHNNFHGSIGQIFMKGSKLSMISLSQNHFHGPIPRELRVLILQSNGFHGIIEKPETNFGFPKLRVIDLSNKNFIGKLPLEYFQIWKGMESFGVDRATHMQGQIYINNGRAFSYMYSMALTNKGIKREYWRIQDFFVGMDLSSNKFDGEIPNIMGNLKALKMLNLSNNVLSGSIPSSFANLSNLESLDLSQNMLSREIPPQLLDFTFLSFLSVSHNHLVGPIPQGKQFLTFENNSFNGNVGLCGSPLSKKCANSEDLPTPPPNFEAKLGLDSIFEFGWKVVAIGYGCGFIVGVLVGQIIIKRNRNWFMKCFAIGHPTGRRVMWTSQK
uniref:Leucine-rich repeat-containing N-terminal plant-type domain-containing protein n=1 Tax=Quercus lobata TaxID=97700 RepID=A0A7N2MLJ4_QUELO